MKVRVKPGAKPYRCKARKYPAEVSHFLDDFNDKLVELGWEVMPDLSGELEDVKGVLFLVFSTPLRAVGRLH
ncbi:hypothetical protein L917_08929 [Phytophthora nicotianae]|uniref:Uncharacterized protein n=1 Tax=Phytophthora nicotianae TaxID=4792 RepID=W2L631_PHYNI|nr:hypothetical protein L917_08929 [Phytophthora nicotianae]